MKKAMVRSKDGLVLSIRFDDEQMEEMIKTTKERIIESLCSYCPYKEDVNE